MHVKKLRVGQSLASTLIAAGLLVLLWLTTACTGELGSAMVDGSRKTVADSHTSGSVPSDTGAVVEPARKPSVEWERPEKPVVVSDTIQIANLATLIATSDDSVGGSSSASLDYIVSFIVFTQPTAVPAKRLSPDPAQVFATDSLNNRYNVTYTELFRDDGVTLGAVAFRGVQAGRKTFALQIGVINVQSDQTPPVAATGSWKIDLIKQVSDNPVPGRLTGGPSHNPVEANGTSVTWEFGGTGPIGTTSAITIRRSGGSPVTIYTAVTQPGGAVRMLTKSEFEQYWDSTKPQ